MQHTRHNKKNLDVEDGELTLFGFPKEKHEGSAPHRGKALMQVDVPDKAHNEK